jgi:hypothetical protein
MSRSPFGRLSNARSRARRGSALLESALVLILMIVVLIGIVDIGQVLVFHQGLVERARAGARWAVVNPYDSNRIKNVVVYNTPQPPPSAEPLLNLDPTMITTALVDSDTPEARIVVTISDYRFYFLSPFIAGGQRARPIAVSMPVEEM